MGLFTPDIYKLKKNNRIKELVKLLDHKDAGVRYSAFAALAVKTGLDNDIISRMKSLMYTDPDPWIKTMVTLRFATIGDPSISENLLQIIRDGSRKSKLELLRFIADHGPSADVTVLQIIIIGLADSSILIRLQAITTANAVKNNQLIPYLGKMLDEKQYKARLLAAKALYNIDRHESVEYLIKLLADTNLKVLSAVRTYLAAIHSDRSYRILDTPLVTENGDEKVYERAVQGIRQETIMKALTILYTAGQHRYRVIRVEALKSIAIFKHQSSIEFVEKLLYDRFPEVRIEALYTLEKIGGKRALEAIEKMGKDKKKIVREAVDKVLTRMRKPAGLI